MMMLDAKHQMRTTLTLDDDVLAAAKVLARQRRLPIGTVISDLARQALRLPGSATPQEGVNSRNGLPVLPFRRDSLPVDLELVNSLRDETP